MKKRLLSLGLLLMTCFGAMADDLTINSEADWEAFASSDTYATGTITLAADITVAKSYASSFSGTFDGQGHTITLEPADKKNFALFQKTVQGAVIKNLNVTGDMLKYGTKTSGLIMDLTGETTVENVHSTVNISSTNYPVAGFVASCSAPAHFINCSYNGSLQASCNASVDVSCFISTTSGNGSFSFKNCSTAGTIKVNGGGWRCANYVSTDNVSVGEAIFENCIMGCDMLEENGSERMGGFIGSPNANRVHTFTGCLATAQVKRWTSNDNHTVISSTNCLVLGCNQWNPWKYTTTNCYYTTSCDYGNTDARQFQLVADELIANGALCYALNGNQSDIAFYQTLGEDAAPVLDSTHKQVYAAGRKHCDGSDYEGVTYNNEGGSASQDEHDFQNGFCQFCGELNLDEDGNFHINNDATWQAFANILKQGKSGQNVKLDADITVTEMLVSGYRGIFDGQGHTITLNMGAETGKFSLFNTIGAATVKNLILDGEITGESNTAPVCCYAGGNLTLENIISNVTVTQTTLNDGNCGGVIGCANANVTFRNVIFAGYVNAMKDAGGFAGWGASRTFTLENCAMIGEVTTTQGAKSVFLRVQANSNTYNVTNCYYAPCTPTILFGNGSEMCGKAVQIDQDAIASGALCFALNGDQSKINFYQTIDEDDMPTIVATHGQVYANGRRHCDGSDYEDLAYSNTAGETIQDEHEYENNYCSYCGHVNADENGVFHIVDEGGYKAFAKAVAEGSNTLSAVLESDVTITDECPMIGTAQSNYAGTFDGQSHTLNVNITSNAQAGVFQFVKGATIKNLIVEGAISGTQTGMIGEWNGEKLTIENVIMKANVTGTINVGGILGTGSAGSKFPFSMKNVIVASHLAYTGAAGGNGVGGFAGWSGYGDFTAENCAMIGDAEGNTSTFGYMFRVKSIDGNNYCSINIKNCYYRPVENIHYCNGNGSERAAGTPIETAADGELCYLLNGSSWEAPVFFQNIGVDEIPNFMAENGVVYKGAEGYISTDVTTPEGVSTMVENLVAEAESIVDLEEHPAQKSLAEAFTEAFDPAREASTFEELVAAYYPAINEARQALDASQKAYAAYIKKVEETKAYLEEHDEDFKKGEMFSKLEVYLEGDVVDPDEEEYPNGSFGYIMDTENLLLDTEQLEAEKKFIDKMLEDALNEGLNAGADITTMLTNADFTDGFNAWEGTKMTAAVLNEDKNMSIAESWSNKPFDMYQTINVPENGIYELQINGAYRLNNIGDSQQHGAMVYLNGCQNYLQADIEDMLPIDEAVHRLNCWIEGGTEDFLVNDMGYTMHGQQGAAYAFLAGRYPNRILCNVTDGKLTVGIKNSHVLTTDNEWVAVGNLKLTYCGTLDEAGEALDATLQSMKDRADFILDTYQPASDMNYVNYPNYSNEIKNVLREKVAAIATTTEAADKYALIQEIGDLFQTILDCKQSYSHMFAMAEALALWSETVEDLDKANAVADACATTEEGFAQGKYTKAEADQGGDLKSCGIWPTFTEDGIMQINNADELDIFASFVNGGFVAQNAVLTNDIVANETYPMAGSDKYRYAGTFDGQGHTITLNLNLPQKNHVGLFRYAAGATICNLNIKGDVLGEQNTGALVAEITGSSVVYNVSSAVNVFGGNNTGGFFGFVGNGNLTFHDLIFSGYAETNVNGVGGICGWSSDCKVQADNLISIGEIVGDQAAYLFRAKCDGTIGTAGDAGCRVTGGNMYYLSTSDPSVIVSGTPLWWGEFLTDVIEEVTQDQLKSGMITYKLNNGNTEAPLWRQTIGVDAAPMLNSKSKIVFEKDGSYTNDGENDDKKGDVSGDGVVDGQDIVVLVNIVNGAETDAATYAKANINGDSTVDGQDIVALVSIVVNEIGVKELRLQLRRYNIFLDDEE